VKELSKYESLLSGLEGIPGGVIQAFHAIQKEEGYLTEEALLTAAKVFGIPVKEAYEVATFYSYFSTKPRGKNIIRVCESAPCHVAGINEVVAALERELEIKMGETTPDGKFTLETTECVGQCQGTPVITVNGKPHVNVSASSIKSILNGS
jgi:NADH-quinone oxidoreductase subunit E